MSSIFDDDLNLPGVITHVEADYSYGYDSSLFGTTDSELVIGTAFNGPVGQPIPIYSTEHAAYIFGNAYDAEKRQEVSLVAGIQDAWARGCRTIYGVRVGGKEVYKDFNFNIDSNYKLRLSSRFPSNIAKDCYILYDGTLGAEKLTFFKPTTRATIAEKKRGLVESSAKMLFSKMNLRSDYALSANDRLTDLIAAFNSHTFNNVMKLAIVDADGNDVTNSTEAFGLTIGAMLSGVYYIGRDKTAEGCKAITLDKFVVVNADGSNKPYSKFEGAYYRKLLLNTDVSLPYPIYFDAAHRDQFRKYISEAGLSMIEAWDFLEVTGASDKVFNKDSFDYEETSLSKFEIYQRLGSGFAVTAHAIKRNGTDSKGNPLPPRIKETDVEDPNYIVPVEDGIYSVLQDAEIKYRAITCVYADDEITGSLPSREQFRAAAKNQMDLLGGNISVVSKIKSSDLTAPKKYAFSFVDTNADPVTFSKDDITGTEDIYKIVGVVADKTTINKDDYENGTMFFEVSGGEAKLYRIGEFGITEMDGEGLDGMKYLAIGASSHTLYKCQSGSFVEETVSAGSYIFAESLNHIFVFNSDMKNIGSLKSLIQGDDNNINVAATSVAVGDAVNQIVVYSDIFDAMSLEELVSQMDTDEILSNIFSTKITEDGAYNASSTIAELTLPANTLSGAVSAAIKDKELGYNYDLYIPYRTNDNFARQLAQHCTYTELKTTPTWGFIGLKPLGNLSLGSIRDSVNELAVRNFDLYAKNNYGRNMLDRNSLPYPIGKNLSIVFGQYNVTMDNTGYVYTSNGAAGYAGMISILPLDQSSTGQTIELPSIAYNLTQSQLNKLTSAGIVTFRQSFTKGIVVTDGVTMAPAESVFRRLSSSRIAGAVEELIRAACEPYIGKENHATNRNALNTAITSNLNKIKGVLIEDFDFTMNAGQSVAKLSYIEIYYQIVPIYEIRQIRNTIKVVDSITSSTVG